MDEDIGTELLSIADVARRVGSSEQTVRIWIRSGLLLGLRLPGEWRVRGSDLEEWLASRLHEPVQGD